MYASSGMSPSWGWGGEMYSQLPSFPFLSLRMKTSGGQSYWPIQMTVTEFSDRQVNKTEEACIPDPGEPPQQPCTADAQTVV